MTHLRLLTTGVLALLVAGSAFGQPQINGGTVTQHTPVEVWRQQYDQSLRDEYGWLSVAGLTFLPDGTYAIGAGPGSDIPLPAGHAPARVGTIVVTDGVATLELASDVRALLNGQPAPARMALRRAGKEADGTPRAADRVRVGKVEFHLHESGRRLALRVRDPESPIRLGFQGPRWYPVSNAARVVATLKPFAATKPVEVRNILGDPQPYEAPGELEFTWEGQPLRLLAFTSTRGRLQLIFRDAGLGRETYGTRYAYAEPVGDGQYVIDFNRAYNPPCAYNPYTTCPTPPAQNILKVAIRAGEKIYDGPTATASR